MAPGFHHDGEAPAHVVLVGSVAVHPVVVVVDEPGSTLIVHPPLVDGEPADATARLRLLARATGDHTRIRILQELRAGPRTLPDICRALDSPRTTLLHHLALLRAAGLIDVAVSAAEPHVYRLNPSGFDDFARSVRAFTISVSRRSRLSLATTVSAAPVRRRRTCAASRTSKSGEPRTR